MRSVPVLYLAVPAADRRMLEPLWRRYPEARLTSGGLEVALTSAGPEEVLADCCAAHVPVRASVVRRPPPEADAG